MGVALLADPMQRLEARDGQCAPCPAATRRRSRLFREYNDELMHTVARYVHTDSEQTVEDAVAYAWERFMVCQPERNRNWHGWLFRTAQRQAWLLERQRRDHVSMRDEHRDWTASRTPEATAEFREDVEAALDVLKRLPPRLQRVAMLRASGSSTARSARSPATA